MQTFNTNIYDASRNNRSFGGNVVGAWGTYSLNGTFDHSEYFYDTTSSGISGSWPRIAFTRNERPLFGSPVLHRRHGVRAPASRLQGRARWHRRPDLSRFDFSPQIRYPFKKWQWFTVNSTVSWRDTYYTRSFDPSNTRSPR